MEGDRKQVQYDHQVRIFHHVLLNHTYKHTTPSEGSTMSISEPTPSKPARLTDQTWLNVALVLTVRLLLVTHFSDICHYTFLLFQSSIECSTPAQKLYRSWLTARSWGLLDDCWRKLSLWDWFDNALYFSPYLKFNLKAWLISYLDELSLDI